MRWMAFPNGIRPAKRLRISVRHLARRGENFDTKQLLVKQFDYGLIYFKQPVDCQDHCAYC